MTQQTRSSLKELQILDQKIADTRERVRDFDPRFEEVEEPALLLEGELETTRKRLKEMKVEEQRLELTVEEKRVRGQKLQERLKNVRNLREEAAVTSELDMVKRALQSDEQEAYQLIDQIRKLEEREAELAEGYELAEQEVGPARDQLLEERASVQAELDRLEAEREEFVSGVDPAELRVYDAIRGRGGRRAVADLTEDGACGHCFGMVPLQVQSEIRHGSELVRCEVCGVILSAPDPAAQAAEGAAAEAEAAAEADDDGDGADDGSAAGDDGDDSEEE